MLNYLSIIEKSSAFNIIKHDLQSARLSHAYLFVSRDDNFLLSFCEEVCKLLINANETENINKNNLRIEKRIHPDVKFFGLDKTIDSKSATEIVEQAEFSPFEADKKIFILLNIQDMNEASQNKILKTIEEPPENTYFILTASGTNRILQTIMSRVKKIDLESIKRNDIIKMLVDANISQQSAEIYASCSGGNASFAEKIACDNSFIEFYNLIVSTLLNLDGSKDVLKFSNELNSAKVNKNEFFDIATMLLRDVLIVHSNKENLVVNLNIIQALRGIAKKLNVESILQLIEMCIHCKEMLLFNVNNTAVVDEFLYKLAEVKVKCRRL